MAKNLGRRFDAAHRVPCARVRGRRSLAAVLAFVLVVALAGAAAGCSSLQGAPASTGSVDLSSDFIEGSNVSSGLRHEVSTDLERATVERVVDGDTLKVTLASTGASERVRLIGMNTPESVAPEEERDTQEGVDASVFVKDYIKPGDTVWLMTDTEDRDKYDRLLRYVWTSVPTDFCDLEQIRTDMLNAYVVDAGYAVVHAYKPNDAYCDLFYELKDDAQDDERGLWALGDYWAQDI